MIFCVRSNISQKPHCLLDQEDQISSCMLKECVAVSINICPWQDPMQFGIKVPGTPFGIPGCRWDVSKVTRWIKHFPQHMKLHHCSYISMSFLQHILRLWFTWGVKRNCKTLMNLTTRIVKTRRIVILLSICSSTYAWHVLHGAYAVYTPWCICSVSTWGWFMCGVYISGYMPHIRSYR